MTESIQLVNENCHNNKLPKTYLHLETRFHVLLPIDICLSVDTFRVFVEQTLAMLDKHTDTDQFQIQARIRIFYQ